MVPFGGYVKFFGDDPSKKVPDHLKERSFFFVSPVKRFLIVAAGPVSNLILAFFIFAFIAIIGEPLISSYIADVSPDSPAWEAGFRPGDRITSLNEQPVHTFEEIFEIIRESEIKPMSATVFRGGIEETIQFTPQITDSVNYYGEPVKIPSLPGLSIDSPTPVVGISNPQSIAAKAGFKTGDRIISVNGNPVNSWSLLREYLLSTTTPALHFIVQSEKEKFDVDLKLPEKYFSLSRSAKLEFLGLHPTELFLGEILPDSPSFQAGLKPGDRVISIDGEPVPTWEAFSRKILAWNGENPLELRVERQGKIETFKISPQLQEHRAPIVGKLPKDQFRIGVVSQLEFAPKDFYLFSTWNPIKITTFAAKKTWHWLYLTVESLVKLITGKVPLQALGGPIFIGSLAGSSLERGLYHFLNIMAIISVNLGLLNLLPIPVLDGGHLLFYGMEIVFRRPTSMRLQTIAQQIGVTLLILLMILVLYNDIRRYWGSFKDYFSGLW